MILVVGRFGGLTTGALVSALEASTTEPIRFVWHRAPDALPASGRIEQFAVRPHLAEDRRRALEGVHTVIMVAAPQRGAAEFEREMVRDARAAGVRRLVLVSLAGADPNSPAELLRRVGRLERAVAESGVPHTIFRCAPFMQSIGLFREDDAGTLVLAGPFRHTQFAWIDARDVGEIVARTLAAPPAEAVVQLCGPEALRFDDIANALCACMACDCAFEDLSIPQAHGRLERKGMASDDARMYNEYWDYLVSGVVCVQACNTAERLLGRPLRRLSDWAVTLRDGCPATTPAAASAAMVQLS